VEERKGWRKNESGKDKVDNDKGLEGGERLKREERVKRKICLSNILTLSSRTAVSTDEIELVLDLLEFCRLTLLTESGDRGEFGSDVDQSSVSWSNSYFILATFSTDA
jgi:hypothetical protein